MINRHTRCPQKPHHGNVTNSTRLYYVEILPLIKFNLTLQLKANVILEEHQIQAVVNSRKEIPATQQQVRDVMALQAFKLCQ